MMQPTPAPSSVHGSPEVMSPPDDNFNYPPPPPNRKSVPFSVLAGLFEKLQNERRHERRKKLLGAWFSHWREEIGLDLYPVLRLILPQKDNERSVYGLKEKNLAKTYIKLIPLGIKDPDAIRMLNWKKPTEREKASGDFPTVLYEVVNKRSSVIEGTLSIDDLNTVLDELANTMGKQVEQSRILQRVYNRSTPGEQRWIVHIILKDLVISVKETTVFAVFHPDAQDLYNTCSDLKKVAWTLWDPNFRLTPDDKGVRLFHAFAPMLCKRPTKKLEETVLAMGLDGTEFIIEEKLDGERMQLHKRGDEYFYCSRKGKNYTYLYGKHADTGSLSPYVAKAFDSRVSEIILDGEMLVWDPVSERNLPFGTLKTAALDKSKKEHNPRPCFKVFDLLYLNGLSLLNRSVTFRKKNMRSCLKEIKGRIEFGQEYKGRSAHDIRQRMEEVMADRGEGLVIKHPKAKYVLNGRNMDWIKVKPEYMDNMGETVDVLVVAGSYGSGSRGGGVSTLVCAVLDDRRQLEEFEDPKYSTFVRIGSGLTFADYVWVRSKPWKVWDPKNPPEFLEIASKGSEDKGDVYLDPEDSFILKIKAAEVVTSDQYHLGITMRFPRAMKIRDDLSIAECMTANEVLDTLRSTKKRKMEGDVVTKGKKRKIIAKKPSMIPGYQGVNLKEIPVDSNILEGYSFVVMPDPKSKTKDEDKSEMITKIHANGGRIVQIAKRQENLFVVYGGSVIPYDLKLIINKDLHDVIRPSWIDDSIQLGQQAPLSRKYFFHATGRSREEFGFSDQEEEEKEPTIKEDDEDCSAAEVGDVAEEMTPKADDIDDGLANWFKVEPESSDKKPLLPLDSETEDDDSDNEDVLSGDVDADNSGQDEWFKVPDVPETKNQEYEASAESTLDTMDDTEESKMGENDSAMEYDQNSIFKHLCFYLDTPKNARKHGMTVKTKHEKDIEAAFENIKSLIILHGGSVADLNEPRLTHVIIDKRDDSRRVELIKRTSKPKRRRLVISEYIQACLDEQTLLDEEEFMP